MNKMMLRFPNSFGEAVKQVFVGTPRVASPDLQKVPEHIRSDNGAEITARIVRNWLAGLGAKTLYIEPGSPWKNGYCESFNGKLRDDCLQWQNLL